MKRAYKLFDEVLSVSHASTWEEARTKWNLQQLFRDDSAERSCACGKTPILNVCLVHNALTDNLLAVGNCCVHKFLMLPSKRIFAAFKRLVKATSEELERGLLNQEAIAFITQQQWLQEHETKFYLDVHRRRGTLSQKQASWLRRLNERVRGAWIIHNRQHRLKSLLVGSSHGHAA